MNERIRELVGQAKFMAEETINKQISKNAELDAFAEKFAELIVAECVQTLLDNTPDLFTNEVAEEDWDKGYDRAMRDCVHHIKEHFGVKL